MLNFVTDSPHIDNNTNATNSSTNNVNRLPVSKDHVETFHPEVSNCESQLENRRIYLQIINANNSRATIFPCLTSQYDTDDLIIRRKQEILMHNKQSTKLTKKQYYSTLATSNAASKQACFTDTPAITSNIPLYNYALNTIPINSQPFNNIRSKEFIIQSINNASSNTPFQRIANTAPPNNSRAFSLTLPIKAIISGNLTSTNDTKYMELTITRASLKVKDLRTGENVLNQVMDISNLSKMTITLNQNGNFEAGLYLGNCIINNFVVPTFIESVLELSVETTHTLFHARDADLLIPTNAVTVNTNILVNVTSNAKIANNCSINEPVKSFIATNLS